MTRRARRLVGDVTLRTCALLARPDGIRHAVVMYHAVGAPLGVGEELLDRQVAHLVERFHVVALRDLRMRVAPGGDRPVTAITFDDGRLDHYEVAAPVLERHGVRGTFFVATGLLDVPGHVGPADVADLARRGHEVGAHTVTHPMLTRVPPARAQDEVTVSKAALEDLVGEPVVSFAYPKGDYDAAVREIVGEAGFAQAVTVHEAHVTGADAVDWLALPRVAVQRGSGMAAFRAKLGPGLGLYERLRGR